MVQVNRISTKVEMTTKKKPILFRVQPATKAALEKIAADQERSVSFILDKITVAWLQQHGHLPKVAKRKTK